jgi:tetratricopeptide (TPR) repeat protein
MSSSWRLILLALCCGLPWGCASPPTPDEQVIELLENGTAAFLARDLPEAEKNFRAAAALRNDSHYAHLYLAHSLYFQREYADSIAEYERALELTEHTGELAPAERRIAIDQLGMAYGLSGRLLEARTVFEHAIARDPGYAPFHYNLACTHAELKDLERALSALERAVAAEPLPEGLPNPRDDD